MDLKVKKAVKQVIIAGIALYVFWVIWVIHMKIVMIENPGMHITQALSMGFADIFKNPFKIFPLAPGTFGWIVGSTMVWGSFISLFALIAKVREHDNSDTVQGDAQWLKNLKDYNKRFTEPFGEISHDGKNNMIMSEDIYLSMDNKKTRRNMNVCVIGGSGSGKSYNFVGPNIMQINCSYAVTDPSGGLFKEYGTFLEYYGYNVKCFNLAHMDRGSRYNPFNYIHSDKDVEIMVSTLIRNTTPPEASKGDPFWEKSETALLIALIAYLHHYTTPNCQNFTNVMRLMRSADIDENDSSMKSPLDYIFEEVSEYDPESFAVKQYQTFKMGAGKTLKSILISCAVRLQAFDLRDVAALTDEDDINLYTIGDEKTALFIILPTGDKTFNFLAAMMYSQLFQTLYEYAENTAEFSQLIIDGEKQVLKTFRANSPEESEEMAIQAEEFLKRATEGTIVHNPEFNWYELRTRSDELVLHRGKPEMVKEALKDLQEHGQVICNNKQSNSGQRLPVHLRMLLDEFANIGQIPEFETKVATIRKYEISVSIILQSLTQLQKMYKDNWAELVGNCDTTIYLGGGADTVTTKWVSELLGKETRAVMSETFGKSASTSINRQGVELLSPAQIRTMEEDQCIVIPKSLFAYKGKKFMTHNHPQRPLVESLDPYYFDRMKQEYLKENLMDSDDDYEETPEDVHGEVVNETPLEEEERYDKEQEKEQRKEESEINRDAEGEKVIEDAKDVDISNEEFAEKVATENQREEDYSVKDRVQEMTNINEDTWGVEELIFSSSVADDYNQG